MGRTDTEPSFLRGYGTATFDELGKSGAVQKAYLRAFEDFMLKHRRVPDMDKLRFQGGFSPAGVNFEIAEEVPGT